MILGEVSFRIGDIATSYASIQAVLQAERSMSAIYSDNITMLLAKCHLARGDLDQTEKLLKPLMDRSELQSEVYENLAACALARGDLIRVRELLEKIAPNDLSLEGHALLEGVRAKLA